MHAVAADELHLFLGSNLSVKKYLTYASLLVSNKF